MKRLLQIGALVAALALPVFCQSQRLSNHDQHEFDEAYNKWVKDSRKNDRDDIRKDERKMQSIMDKYNIPPDVPFDRIATNGDRGYDRDRYDNDQGRYDNRDRGYYPQNGGSRLSPDDQRDFDRAYSKWIDDTRRNDGDDVRRDERTMQDIMARYNIPSDVPFDQIVSPRYGR